MVANNSDARMAWLSARVNQLEHEVLRLRASRRVLLDLLTMQDRQQRLRIGALERENYRLRQRNRIRHN
ncbi:MAG: hypothetical protein C7B45_02050 [Sulfobacillus acidophilus]|uniref:Translation initiation factor 2 n=1 Tax=Sulfobacillus acidophilus TaxID=53633 RepID=A0A2T2WNL0_9FIRM|nr:MAG: hypothetical protein C7B45_02050 [Sulfobacillus acidophilus]